MMLRYARIRGLRRFILSFPVPKPELSSRFGESGLPLSRTASRSRWSKAYRTEVVVRSGRARAPSACGPPGYDEAVRLTP